MIHLLMLARTANLEFTQINLAGNFVNNYSFTNQKEARNFLDIVLNFILDQSSKFFGSFGIITHFC
jgi:hypothetical protein